MAARRSVAATATRSAVGLCVVREDDILRSTQLLGLAQPSTLPLSSQFQ